MSYSPVQMSLDLLVVNLGLSFHSFQVLYEHYGEWVTTSWLKRVWEKVDHYEFVLLVHNLLVTFPWEGDDWLMARFIVVGCSEKELQSLNRERKHQQVLFLSDILGASGGTADKRYLQKRWRRELWSSMKFPHEDVTELEMGLWCKAIVQVVAYGPVQASLGKLTTEGHKVWKWQIQESNARLF
jgi:hypothetical protein